VNALANDPGGGLDPQRRGALSFVEFAHRADRRVDRRVLGGIERARGVREFARRHLERFDLHAVEAARQLAQCRIAAPAYGCDDGAHVAHRACRIALRGPLQNPAAFVVRQ
jgi:hypothetical protein